MGAVALTKAQGVKPGALGEADHLEQLTHLVLAQQLLNGCGGPHIFRHARAVEMLRAAVPTKIIGDMLGHRSAESTAPYLKLATEDLRDIALDVPGREARS